jgi:hypothetical protein
MGRLLPLMVLVDLALVIVALIDCLSTDEVEIRALPKIIWVLLILLFSPVGPVVWFIAGRPKRAVAPGTGGAGGTAGRWPTRGAGGPRQVAPDDDPEFLRGLSSANRKEQEERLRAWEDDLHRREEELRRKGDDGEEPSVAG